MSRRTRHNKHNQTPKTYSYFDLMSWIQCNSEHSRHWIFRTPLHSNTIYTNPTNTPTTTTHITTNTNLLELIKSTLTSSSSHQNSIIAFSDNSSAIQGIKIPLLTTNTYSTSKSDSNTGIYTYQTIKSLAHPTLTAETHNYPTYYHPFQGAATGVGEVVS